MYFPIILAVINQQFHLFLKATHNKLSLVTDNKKKELKWSWNNWPTDLLLLIDSCF